MSFVNRKPKKLSDEPLLNFNEPQIIFFSGMRGSGKGVSVDFNAEKLYKEGINIWHLWSARSLENLYWAINKKCGVRHKISRKILNKFFDLNKNHYPIDTLNIEISGDELQKHLEIMELDGFIKILDNGEIKILEKSDDFLNGDLLHCKCERAYPISWIVPDYIEMDEDSLTKFNTQYFDNWKDYNSAYEKGHVKKYLDPFNWDDSVKIAKPESMVKPLIIVRKITPATTPHRKEVFREQFTEIVIEARDQNRVVVMNPSIFEGSADKFETISEIFRFLPYLMNVSGHFTKLKPEDVGKPEKDFTKKQRSWHKVAIILNELRTVAPSSRLSGESNAGKSKKSIFDTITEMRHFAWLIGDYQNSEDLYAGIKHQSNAIVLKNSSRNLAGDDLAWLFDAVEKKRLYLTRKYYPDAELKTMYYYERDPNFKAYLDDIYPKVDELAKNLGYITYPNREFKLEQFDLPSFHHKDSLESFLSDTGITWTVNMDLKPIESNTIGFNKEITKVKKKQIEELMQQIDHKRTIEKLSWIQIREELIMKEKDGTIPLMGFEDKDNVYFSNMYNRWKKNQTKESVV